MEVDWQVECHTKRETAVSPLLCLMQDGVECKGPCDPATTATARGFGIDHGRQVSLE